MNLELVSTTSSDVLEKHDLKKSIEVNNSNNIFQRGSVEDLEFPPEESLEMLLIAILDQTFETIRDLNLRNTFKHFILNEVNSQIRKWKITKPESYEYALGSVVYKWLKEIVKNPVPSLQELCRVSIDESILYPKGKSLELLVKSQSLRKFLSFL